MTLIIFREGEMFASLIPEKFKPVMQDINGFLTLAGEARCAEMYAVCKDYTADEMTIVVGALMDDLFTMSNGDTGYQSAWEASTDSTYQMLLAAAHVAPVVVAFDLLQKEGLRKRYKIDQHFRRVVIAVGAVMNLSGADEVVDVIPDMRRNDPIILAGAAASLTLQNKPTCSKALIRYMGEHWRELAPFADVMAHIPRFEVKDAMHLLEGGHDSLIGGAL